MNRVLMYLGGCDAARARRLRARVEREAEAIACASGGLVHIFPPSGEDLLTGQTDCGFLLDYHLRDADVPVNDLAGHIARELRTLGSRMLAAANGLEALARKGGV